MARFTLIAFLIINTTLFSKTDLKVETYKLDNGLTVQEISELIAHITLYSGFPTGVNASRMFAEILEDRGIPLPD